jgi:alanine-glyoxylate transaminase / serine-glyoxylate transaminase / serine-pyruvate transaminase
MDVDDKSTNKDLNVREMKEVPSRQKSRAFRIGHLGDFNELMLAGTLCGVEMGLALSGTPHNDGGVAAALQYLTSDPYGSA